MTTILAILAGLKTFASSALAVAAKIPWQVWACVAIFLAGGYVFHGGSCRDFACRRTPQPHPIVSEWRDVVEVPNGATIEVKAGLLGRRTATIALAHIAAPGEGQPGFDESRANLAMAAGRRVRIEREGRGGIFGAGETVDEGPDEEGDVSAIGNEPAVVYSATGAMLNVVQVLNGWAMCLPDAPKDFWAQEKIAKREKRGLWK